MSEQRQLRSPYDDGIIAEIALDGPSDVERKLEAAVAAFSLWRELSIADRCAMIEGGLARFMAESERTADEISRQMGKPIAQARKEVETFLPVADESEAVVPKRSKARFGFGIGETVRVKEGPFADFSGAIQEINEDQLKVKVLVNIFGRETPVELEFSQVAQL